MKQSYTEYLRCRIEFALAVGMFVEFDHEVKLLSDFTPLQQLQNMETIKPQLLRFKHPKEGELGGDVFLECMKYAKIFRKSPVEIATRLATYLSDVEGLDRTEIVGGYLNIYYSRAKFLINII